MKIAALYGPDGTIASAVEIVDGYDGPMPVAGETTRVGVFETRAESAEGSLLDVCLAMRVDPASQRLVRADEAERT